MRSTSTGCAGTTPRRPTARRCASARSGRSRSSPRRSSGTGTLRHQLVDTYRSYIWQRYRQHERGFRRQCSDKPGAAPRFSATLTIRMCQGGSDEVWHGLRFHCVVRWCAILGARGDWARRGTMKENGKACPGCGSAEARRHGRDRQGRQLFRCCACRGRFTARTATPFSGYRFPPEIIALAVR
jgi:hypothetical protein